MLGSVAYLCDARAVDATPVGVSGKIRQEGTWCPTTFMCVRSSWFKLSQHAWNLYARARLLSFRASLQFN